MENIVVKANKSLGFVRRNLYPCSEITKRSAYVTIVRPTLEYATAVWDPYRQEQIDSNFRYRNATVIRFRSFRG